MNRPTGSTSRVAIVASGAVLTVTAIGLVRCDRAGGVAVPYTADMTDYGICIGNCVPDPGSAPADCSQEDAVDTLPIESFDDFASTDGTSAQDLFTYSDGTALINYGSYNLKQFYNVIVDPLTAFQPPVESPPASIAGCNQNGTYPGVLHVFGGEFLGWGGGMGLSMSKLNGRDPTPGGNGMGFAYQDPAPTFNTPPPPLDQWDPTAPKDVCCRRDSQGNCLAYPDPRYTAICPPADAEYAVSIATVDVSQYEGVSFWARRGPNGQEGLRLLVGDKYTDDDLNYIALKQQAATGTPQPTYCHRNRECGCTNHQECNAVPKAQLSLPQYNNMIPPGPGSLEVCGTLGGPILQNLYLKNMCLQTNVECVGLNGGPSVCCDVSNCNNVYPAYPCDYLPEAGAFAQLGSMTTPGDVQFYGKPCTPYAWPNGVESSYCYDPNTDPPPSPPTELCGDFWMTTVDLTTDWQYFKVPFSVLRQQGFAMKTDHLDLHSVSTVRFSWDIGWIDYWVDRISFYRAKSDDAGAD